MLVPDSDEKTLFTRALRIFSEPRRAPIASSNEMTKKKKKTTQGKSFFTSFNYLFIFYIFC